MQKVHTVKKRRVCVTRDVRRKTLQRCYGYRCLIGKKNGRMIYTGRITPVAQDSQVGDSSDEIHAKDGTVSAIQRRLNRVGSLVGSLLSVSCTRMALVLARMLPVRVTVSSVTGVLSRKTVGRTQQMYENVALLFVHYITPFA